MPDQVSPMLSVGQFAVGPIAAASGLTLVLPRTKYESMILVNAETAGRTAVLLNGHDPFVSFPADNNTRYSGVLVPGVDIEVDPTLAYDAQYADIQLGTIVRSGTMLSIATASSGSMRFRSALVPLVSGLPELPEGQSAGFSTWRVVLGSGPDRQVLASFSIVAPVAP